MDGLMEKQDHDLLMIQTWWGKVWTRRSLGHLVVLPKASTAVKTIFVVAKTLVVLFKHFENLDHR